MIMICFLCFLQCFSQSLICFSVPEWSQDRSKMVPQTAQSASKTGPRESERRSEAKLRSWVDCGPLLAPILGPSWSLLGAILGPSWAILAPSWGHLGPSRGCPGLSWDHLGTILEPSWATLGPSWVIFSAILGYLETVFGILGPTCAISGPFCAILDHLGPILAPFLFPLSFANLGFPTGKRTFA